MIRPQKIAARLRQRSIGVAEAGVGLSLLIGLLIVLGYVALQRVGGTGQTPTVEIIRPGSSPSSADDPAGRLPNENGLQVLQTHDAESLESVRPHALKLQEWPPLLEEMESRRDVPRGVELDSAWPALPTDGGEPRRLEPQAFRR
jgi:hypothetical protein